MSEVVAESERVADAQSCMLPPVDSWRCGGAVAEAEADGIIARASASKAEEGTCGWGIGKGRRVGKGDDRGGCDRGEEEEEEEE